MAMPSSSITTQVGTVAEETYRCKHGETPKLTHYNYPMWNIHKEAFLAAEDAFDIVIQYEPRPPATRLDAIRNYKKRTSHARAILLYACHSSIITYVAEEEDPAEMWTILARICDTTASIAGRTAIYRSFYELKPIAGELISSYCFKLQNY